MTYCTRWVTAKTKNARAITRTTMKMAPDTVMTVTCPAPTLGRGLAPADLLRQRGHDL